VTTETGSNPRGALGLKASWKIDLLHGWRLPTGALGDPTTTRHSKQLRPQDHRRDKGDINYNPVAHKWLSLTGRKICLFGQRNPDYGRSGHETRKVST